MMTLLRALRLILVLLLGLSAGCNRDRPVEKPYALVGSDGAEIQRAFNSDVGKTRIVMLASPT